MAFGKLGRGLKVEVQSEEDLKLAMAREARRFTAREGVGALLAVLTLGVLVWMSKSHTEMAERAHGKVETLSTNIAQLTEAIHGSTAQAQQSAGALQSVANKIESLERLHEDGGFSPPRAPRRSSKPTVSAVGPAKISPSKPREE